MVFTVIAIATFMFACIVVAVGFILFVVVAMSLVIGASARRTDVGSVIIKVAVGILVIIVAAVAELWCNIRFSCFRTCFHAHTRNHCNLQSMH